MSNKISESYSCSKKEIYEASTEESSEYRNTSINDSWKEHMENERSLPPNQIKLD